MIWYLCDCTWSVPGFPCHSFHILFIIILSEFLSYTSCHRQSVGPPWIPLPQRLAGHDPLAPGPGGSHRCPARWAATHGASVTKPRHWPRNVTKIQRFHRKSWKRASQFLMFLESKELGKVKCWIEARHACRLLPLLPVGHFRDDRGPGPALIALHSQSAQAAAKLCKFLPRWPRSWQWHPTYYIQLGRGPRENCKNDLDDQTWRELE